MLTLAVAAVPLALLYLFWPPVFLWSSGQLGYVATTVTGLMAMALVGVVIGLVASALAAGLVAFLRRNARHP
jgi:hypothetical protein